MSKQKVIMNPDFVAVVKAEVQTTTAGGILLTQAEDPNDLSRYIVKYTSGPNMFAASPDLVDGIYTGVFSEGDEVVISPKNTIRTRVLDEECYFVKIKDIWAYLPKDGE